MNARHAIGWGALGAGAGVALLLAVQGTHPSSGASGDDADVKAEKPAAGEDQPAGVAVPPALRARLGLQVVPLAASSAPAELHGLARGLDAGPLAAIEADIAAAQAAATASAAEERRLTGLAAADQSASRQAVEAAHAQALADAAKLHLAEQRVALEFGPGLAAMGDGGRRRLLADITRGAAALVRVDLPVSAPVGSVRLQDGGTIRLIGPAAQADPRLQSPGLLGLVSGAAAQTLNAGRVRDVVVAGGPPRSGVFVPSDAVVRWHGSQWIYRGDGARFARIELDDAQPVPGGWLAASGLKAGDRVAVRGAGALLAIDRASDLAQESD
jgi:hypothetical protein